MDITFNCTKCGQHIVIDEAGAGTFVNCPKCEIPLRVPFVAASKPSTSDIQFATCPNCGEDVFVTDQTCLHCGQNLRKRIPPVVKPLAATTNPSANLIRCPDCAREVSKRAASCPHCGAPIAQQQPTAPAVSAGAMTCPVCKLQLVSKEKARGGVTLAGVFGGLLFVSGILSMFTNEILGGVLIVAGVVISVALRGKDVVLVCPRCKKEWSKV